MACRNQAGFAVVEPIVDNRRRPTGKHLTGSREIKVPVPQREIPLCRIEVDFHGK